ncbi:hypothetical protein [Bradyrhizobium sp.]|uniref:hypothetical protein n=1 Tax=Bradyrhizobium sp. TaxID=376 RepID=UPI0026125546|nr:hypothetical protein [Bradyrhizobium sp.]
MTTRYRVHPRRAYDGEERDIGTDVPITENNVVAILTAAGLKPELDDSISIFRREAPD